MPDLLRYGTANWTLNVWTRDIEPARAQWRHMLADRNSQNAGKGRFLPDCTSPGGVGYGTGFNANGDLSDPVFFENRAYEFEFTFCKDVTDPSVTHRLSMVCDSFRSTGNSIRGTLNLGNDIGWFRLGLEYTQNGQRLSDKVSFEVLPLKMDLEHDIGVIQKDIDGTFPLWRFSFGQKTEQEMARSNKPHERFPLLWLALFASLREELEEQVRIVCNAPHNRLQPFRRVLPMDRIRGKVSKRLEEKIGEALAVKAWEKRFRVEGMRLSVDTPENRFVKMVLVTASRRIAGIADMARARNRAPDQQQISDSFFSELGKWRSGLDSLLANPLFAEVGTFDGMERESLVLHHRAGYAGVYRVWQQLKQYLDVLGKDADISVKSVAELYEVWCFLEMRKLLEAQGFDEEPVRSAQLVFDSSGLEVKLRNGLGPSFNYSRADGVKARLAHEPLFDSPTGAADSIYSWTVPQKPDIVLEVSFPDGEKLLWVFDAKYRVADSGTGNGPDRVPDDAINQMHRYRDALVYRCRDSKTRPVIGAFALYPGWYPSQGSTVNPYSEAIRQVGIGAFPLLPGQEGVWLREFLGDRLVRPYGLAGEWPVADRILAQDSVRIPPEGLKLTRGRELVLVAPVGPDRSGDYLEAFRNGKAHWYHTRDEALVRFDLPSYVMQDLTHCAIAIPTGDELEIRYVYDVRSVARVARSQITEAQAGVPAKDSTEPYWIVRLGGAIPLANPIRLPASQHFEFRLTNTDGLLAAKDWATMPWTLKEPVAAP